MFSGFEKLLSIGLSSALILTPMLPAQQTSPGSAPIPPEVLTAHAVFVSNGGGSNYFEIIQWRPESGLQHLYSQLKRTGHYELVSSPAQADVIFEIRAIAPAESSNDVLSYNPQVILTIRDPRTNAVFWTESANVRAVGTKGRRDKDFDQSVAVLVDKLGVVTGQPLTTAQEKAIAANSRMSTAAKVFIFASIGAAAAMTAYGIHMIENPPKLNPPATPGYPATSY